MRFKKNTVYICMPLFIYIYIYIYTYIHTYIYIYIYDKRVTGMAWIYRVLNTIIGRAKTQIKGKFLFAVTTLSFTRLGYHQATDRSFIYSYS